MGVFLHIFSEKSDTFITHFLVDVAFDNEDLGQLFSKSSSVR